MGRNVRHWGSMKDPVPAGYRIERATRDELQRLAKAAGISASALIEELVARVERDADGAPVWADELHNHDEELPIGRAA